MEEILGTSRLQMSAGGIGMFSVVAAALGFRRVVLVDDFSDSVNRKFGDHALSAHRKYGVEVIHRDVVRDGFGEFSECFDVISAIDTIEHWHHSPQESAASNDEGAQTRRDADNRSPQLRQSAQAYRMASRFGILVAHGRLV